MVKLIEVEPDRLLSRLEGRLDWANEKIQTASANGGIAIIDTSFMTSFAKRRLREGEHSLGLVKAAGRAYERMLQATYQEGNHVGFTKEVTEEFAFKRRAFAHRLDTAKGMITFLKPLRGNQELPFDEKTISDYQAGDYQVDSAYFLDEYRALREIVRLLPAEVGMSSDPEELTRAFGLGDFLAEREFEEHRGRYGLPRDYHRRAHHDGQILGKGLLLAQERPVTILTADQAFQRMRDYLEADPALYDEFGVQRPKERVEIVEDYERSARRRKWFPETASTGI